MRGSIEKRGVYKWRLRVDLGIQTDNKRNRPSVTIEIDDPSLMKMSEKCTGYKDASRGLRDYLDDQLSDFKRRVLSGEYIQVDKMTFKEFVENEWKPKYASHEDNLAPLTYDTYCSHLENHIYPAFESKYLSEIKTLHIVTFVNNLSKPGARKDGRGKTLAAGTIQYIYRVLKNVLTRATEWQLIPSNPVTGVKKPKVEQKEVEFYDEVEAKEVIAALYLEPRYWRLLILGAIIGGCRRGELVGLEWSDVDFENMTVSIKKSISQTKKSKAIEKGPKSKSSKRIIEMPDWYMNELDIHLREWELQRKKAIVAGEWIGNERTYVFHAGRGKPLHHNSPTGWWAKFVKRHNLKRIRLHDLRHSSATLLIEAGASMKAIQKRLGHSKYQTTANIYAHVTKKVSRDTAEKFDKFAPRPQSVPNPSPSSKSAPN
ncbi:hypothetical protein J40TS1_23320 [Paenibacillus montaniterrae]|uniref:Site-specific integrase n=1 Tax=Paenibacillus montaniterrae TaxID=429341 RepID=A0A919YNW8_9BACL|nr:hypothetical protein J40TS1_23320 [Paenibacillus montaniterrae]